MKDSSQDSPMFDPARLIDVETFEDIRRVAPDAEGLFVRRLDNAKLAAIAAQVPGIRYLISDGSTRVTDSGLHVLGILNQLEALDLEWSQVTDDGLETIAALETLRWVDIGFCRGVTEAGVARLRRRRPDLEIDFAQFDPL